MDAPIDSPQETVRGQSSVQKFCITNASHRTRVLTGIDASAKGGDPPIIVANNVDDEAQFVCIHHCSLYTLYLMPCLCSGSMMCRYILSRTSRLVSMPFRRNSTLGLESLRALTHSLGTWTGRVMATSRELKRKNWGYKAKSDEDRLLGLV